MEASSLATILPTVSMSEKKIHQTHFSVRQMPWKGGEMLHIKIINDGTGTDKDANYLYDVYINARRIASGEILGHDRSDGWRELVEMILEQENSNE